MDTYHQDAISNGNPREQALIRRWWHEQHGARGILVWEYFLKGCYLDAMFFPIGSVPGVEQSGLKAPVKFPIKEKSVILCEAKVRLTPELVGQALVYTSFARSLQARVLETVIFAETGSQELRVAAEDLGLKVIMPVS